MLRLSRSAPLILAVLAACGRDAPADSPLEPRAATVPGLPIAIAIQPSPLVIRSGDMQDFTVDYLFADGSTAPVTAAWGADANIGTVSPSTGPTTTLSAALPPGEDDWLGLVMAMTADGFEDFVEVYVTDGSQPIGTTRYQACATFSSGGQELKKTAVCPHPDVTYIKVTFPPGTAATAVFDRGKKKSETTISAPPAGAERFEYLIDPNTGLIQKAAWFGDRKLTEIAEAVGKRDVWLALPPGIEIVKVQSSGRSAAGALVQPRIPVPELTQGKKRLPIDDIRLYSKEVE